jgi:hypothetical protein
MTGTIILMVVSILLSVIVAYSATAKLVDKGFVAWIQFVLMMTLAGAVIVLSQKTQDKIGIRTASYTVDTVITTTTVNGVVSSDTTYVIHFTRK